MAEYKNQSWSRVIKVDGFLPGLEEKYEIGPDLFSELQHMQAIDIDSTPKWEPLFDPTEFQRTLGNINFEDWKLDEDQLRNYAQDVMNLRQNINMRAEAIKLNAEEPPEEDYNRRSRKGLKHSTRGNNPGRLLEKEIKQRI